MAKSRKHKNKRSRPITVDVNGEVVTWDLASDHDLSVLLSLLFTYLDENNLLLNSTRGSSFKARLDAIKHGSEVSTTTDF